MSSGCVEFPRVRVTFRDIEDNRPLIPRRRNWPSGACGVPGETLAAKTFDIAFPGPALRVILPKSPSCLPFLPFLSASGLGFILWWAMIIRVVSLPCPL